MQHPQPVLGRQHLLATCAVAGLCSWLAACEEDPPTARPRETTIEDAGAVQVKVDNAGAACSLFSRTCQGPSAQCLEISFSGAFYPGGYCTADCRQSAECGTDAVCPVGEAQRQAPDYDFRSTWARKCFQRCEPSELDACRPGYACMSLAEAYAADDAPAALHQPVCLPRMPTFPWDAGAVHSGDASLRFDAASLLDRL